MKFIFTVFLFIHCKSAQLVSLQLLKENSQKLFYNLLLNIDSTIALPEQKKPINKGIELIIFKQIEVLTLVSTDPIQ